MWCLELGVRKTGEQLLPDVDRSRSPSFRLLIPSCGPVVSWDLAVTEVPPQPRSQRPAKRVQGQDQGFMDGPQREAS